MRRIYLDSNILIPHYSVDKGEEGKREMVENALSVFAELNQMTRVSLGGKRDPFR